MKFTNTQPGPRGLNAISGPVLVDPGQAVEVEVYAREQQHIEAAGWFNVEGSYTDDPETSGPALKAVAADTANEIDDLKKQLAARDAELAKLKAGGSSERDDLKKQAAELGITDFPGNISNVKLKELIDAKLAS
ncbi:hypothetical protein [Rhizobium sp. Root1220]|uniref:hypothetical protein n=1 Tax=Rhizobium sp. Root1220 TaxID=1736432 RepID=UPI000701B7FE|nr:hypothetical protein [Rhizobium sp. Root1220]KQV83245.1 hypothetical protein ASC90_21880 [Rhizobium sp. Root1220]